MPARQRKIRSSSNDSTCGPCTACCTSLPVEGIPTLDGGTYNKPAKEPCVHLAATGGCSIYERRPAVCQAYECLWLLGVRSVFKRPNEDGVLMTGVFDPRTENLKSIQALEVAPGAKEETLIRGFGLLVRQGLPVVFHALNGTTRILAPDAVLDQLDQIVKTAGEAQ